MESPIVTLTTDWGSRDFFAGKVKGLLLKTIPNVRIVDITHDLKPFSVTSAIFVVRNCFRDFPMGTIHIIDVDSSETVRSPFVLVKYEGQFFICTDNGLPHIIFGDQYEKAVVINEYHDSSYYTFAAYSLFCKVARKLVGGTPLEEIGSPIEGFVPMNLGQPYITRDSIYASVCYIDDYGNAYLNVTVDEFEKARDNRPFELRVHFEQVIKQLSTGYVEKAPNNQSRLLLTVSATGCLQLAIYQGSAEKLFGLQLNEGLTIKFLDASN